MFMPGFVNIHRSGYRKHSENPTSITGLRILGRTLKQNLVPLRLRIDLLQIQKTENRDMTSVNFLLCAKYSAA
jgi:hypothetical protein